MKFIIINLNNGSQKTCDLAYLSRSLSPNCEIVRKKGVHCEAVGFVSHKTLVFFAVQFADYALRNYSKQEIVEAKTCISLVKKWIEDSSSVSNEELNAAGAGAADAGAAGAADAAYAAARAVAHAAYATNAAYASAYAAGDNRDKEFLRQGNFILKHFELL